MTNLLNNTTTKPVIHFPNVMSYIEETAESADGPQEDVIKILTNQIQKSATKQFGNEYDIRVGIDEKGKVIITQILTVVKDVTDKHREVSFENARRHNPDVQIGWSVVNPLTYEALDTPAGILTATETHVKNMSLTAKSNCV